MFGVRKRCLKPFYTFYYSFKRGINSVNLSEATINLAQYAGIKPKSCRIRPDSTKRSLPSTNNQPATRISLCTPDQLRSISQPKPCVNAEPSKPLIDGEKFSNAFKLTSKCLLFLGFIKWTDVLGIWGNAESTDQLVNKTNGKISPALKLLNGDSESYYGQTYNLATMWNDGIAKIFYVIGVLYELIVRKM